MNPSLDNHCSIQRDENEKSGPILNNVDRWFLESGVLGGTHTSEEEHRIKSIGGGLTRDHRTRLLQKKKGTEYSKRKQSRKGSKNRWHTNTKTLYKDAAAPNASLTVIQYPQPEIC